VFACGGDMHDASTREWTLFMPDWYSHYKFLIIGIFFFSGGVVSTCIGKTWARTGRTIYRSEEPRTFWWVVVIYYLGALLFVGSYFYQGR
jgi:hypothetical protein